MDDEKKRSDGSADGLSDRPWSSPFGDLLEGPSRGGDGTPQEDVAEEAALDAEARRHLDEMDAPPCATNSIRRSPPMSSPAGTTTEAAAPARRRT